MTESYAVERSWATEPEFYEAPHPPSVQPHPYQFAGAEFALARDHCIVGDAPGLGKSCEGVLISNAMKAKKTLVVCPASLRLNWEREVWLWSTTPNVLTYPVLKASDGVSLEADYLIISYDLLRNENIYSAIMDARWDHVILDEAHYLKSRDTKRTQLITAPDGLPSVTGRFTLATGTLLPNQPSEAYNSIRLCNWDAIDRASYEDFRNFYYGEGEGFVTIRGKRQWSNRVRNQPRNLDDLNERLRSKVMVRRLKEHVLTQLPPKQWHPFPLVVTSLMKEALKHEGWAEAQRLYEMNAHAFDRGVPVDGAISTAMRLLGEAKAPSVADYIDDLFDSGIKKLIVAGLHLSVLKYLRERLAEYGVVYIDGSTSPTKRQLAVDAFQNDDKVGIILGQMLPLGEGWTLTAAQDVVFAEFNWVPGRNDQMLDRINRMGQMGDYTIGHIPVVPGTLDERVLATAIEKDVSIHATLDARAA